MTENLQAAPEPPRRKGESARDYALRALRADIVGLRLEPGAMVYEKELAKSLGVSRTPVREALGELSRTQLVEVLPQRGCRVAKIDYDRVDEVRFVRLTLECAVVKELCAPAFAGKLDGLAQNLALQHFALAQRDSAMLLELDDAFHRALFVLCKCELSYELLHSMSAHYDRLRSVKARSSDLFAASVSDHDAILDAVRRGDARGAQAAMAQHLDRYQCEKAELESRYPSYFKA